MLKLAVGDLTSRLARALGLRGHSGLALDETVAQVMLTWDLSNPLFAQNPAECAGFAQANGTAALPGIAALSHVSQNLTARVKGMLISNPGAGAVAVSWYLSRAGSSYGGPLATSAILNQPARAGGQLLRPQVFVGNVSTAIGIQAFQIGGCQLGVNGTQWVPLDAVLYAQPQPAGGFDAFIVSVPVGVVNFCNVAFVWQETSPS